MATPLFPEAVVRRAEPTNARIDSLIGNGDTIADANEMLAAIAAMSCGTIVESYRVVELPAGERPAMAAGTSYTDALFTFEKTISGKKRREQFRLNNITNAITLDGGLIDVSNALVTALVDAYYSTKWKQRGWSLKSAVVVE